MNTQPPWKNYDDEGRKEGRCYWCGNNDPHEVKFTWAVEIFYCKPDYGCRTVMLSNLGD